MMKAIVVELYCNGVAGKGDIAGLEWEIFKEKRYDEDRIVLIQGLEQHMFKMMQQMVSMEQQRLKLLSELHQTLQISAVEAAKVG